MFSPYKNYRTLRRYQQIIMTLGRYGFGELAGRLNLLGHLKLKKADVTGGGNGHSRAVRFRMMLEQLGPTFIKLGQILSTRPDLLPGDVISELTNLQDSVTATGWEEMSGKLAKYLGADFEEQFLEFDREPIASASIAQVYVGRLWSGEKVAVKVIRPGTEKQFGDDLIILEHLAGLIESHIEESRNWDVRGIVNQFRMSVTHELDLRHEGRNADIFRTHFVGDDTVYVPKVYWDYSNHHVLVMEYVEGRPIDEYFGDEVDIGVRQVLAKRAANAVLKQIYEDGFFHADPHPGNTLVLDGEVICFLDFGMVGRLDDELLSVFARALHAIVKKDADRLLKAARDLELMPEGVKESELRLSVLDLMEQYHGLPLKQISLPALLRDIIGLIGRYQLQVRPDFLFLMKALSTIENTVSQLDADFDLISHTEPFVRSLVLKRYRPGYVLGEAYRFAEDMGQLTRESPEHLLEILRKMRAGKIKLEFQHEGLDEPLTRMNQMSDKMVLGMILAALILSSAVMAHSGVGPMMFGFPVIGGLGFLLAGIAGLVIVVDIMRSRRK